MRNSHIDVLKDRADWLFRAVNEGPLTHHTPFHMRELAALAWAIGALEAMPEPRPRPGILALLLPRITARKRR